MKWVCYGACTTPQRQQLPRRCEDLWYGLDFANALTAAFKELIPWQVLEVSLQSVRTCAPAPRGCYGHSVGRGMASQAWGRRGRAEALRAAWHSNFHWFPPQPQFAFRSASSKLEKLAAWIRWVTAQRIWGRAGAREPAFRWGSKKDAYSYSPE